MMKVGRLALLATTLVAVPSFAQPGNVAPPTPPPGEPPPITAGTVVIVTPQPPTIRQAGAPGQVALDASDAPHNEPWSNVSHINGQVVPVGDRGAYLYDNGKHTVIATNPIGWIFGFYGFSLSHAVHPNFAVRGDANLFALYRQSGHELGLSVPIYFRRVFDGPFLEPGIVTRNLNSGSGNEHVGPEVMFGWQWMFDSGLTAAFALGAMRNLNDRGSGGDGAEVTGYFRVGYGF